MRVVACVAAVPKPAAVKWDRFRDLLDTQDAEPVLNPLDRNALELAARLAESTGPPDADPTTCVVVSAGPHAAAALREAAAFGAARRVALDDDALIGADEAGIGAALAAAIAHLGGADVVCCGAATSSYGSGSVGGVLAAAMGADVVAGVTDVARCDEGVQIDYIAGAAVQRRIVTAPTVLVASAYGVGVRSIAPMTALRAARTAAETLSLADIGLAAPLPSAGVTDGRLAAMRGKRANETLVGGTAATRAQTLVGALRERQAL